MTFLSIFTITLISMLAANTLVNLGEELVSIYKEHKKHHQDSAEV